MSPLSSKANTKIEHIAIQAASPLSQISKFVILYGTNACNYEFIRKQVLRKNSNLIIKRKTTQVKIGKGSQTDISLMVHEKMLSFWETESQITSSPLWWLEKNKETTNKPPKIANTGKNADKLEPQTL